GGCRGGRRAGDGRGRRGRKLHRPSWLLPRRRQRRRARLGVARGGLRGARRGGRDSGARPLAPRPVRALRDARGGGAFRRTTARQRRRPRGHHHRSPGAVAPAGPRPLRPRRRASRLSERMSVDSTLSYSKIVERYAHFFDRPEARLRFLSHTLAQQSASRERADALLRRVPFLRRARLYDQALKLWLYHLIFHELDRHLPSAREERRRILRLKGRAPFAPRLLFGCYRLRRALAVPCLLLLAALLFGAYSGLA